MEPAINGITSRQHALITLDQARSASMTTGAVRHQLDSGNWARQHSAVYRVAGAPSSWQQELLAACLAAGEGAMASHRSAALLWDLPCGTDTVIELTVDRPRSPRLAGVIVHRSTDLETTAAMQRSGIPVTPPARTLVDMGAVAHERIVQRAVDSALCRRLVTVGELRADLDVVARRGRRGAGVLRRVLENQSAAALVAESVLESTMWRLLGDYGLPRPVGQYEVRMGLRFVGRVDFAYPGRRLAIEVDGYESHSSLRAFQHDRARQNELVAAGWMVLRFTWRDVTKDAAGVAMAVRRVLGAENDARQR